MKQDTQERYDDARKQRSKNFRARRANGPPTTAISLEDFYAYMPLHSYIASSRSRVGDFSRFRSTVCCCVY
jgi:hypothetical protein